MKSITAKRLAVMLLVTGMGVSAGRAATFTPVAELPFSARGAVYDPGRARLYLSQSESNRVWWVNPENGAAQGSIAFDFRPGQIALSPDGGTLVVHFPTEYNGSQAYIQSVDVESGVKAGLFPVSVGSVSDLLVLEGGLVVFAERSGIVQSCRLGSGTILGSWSLASNGRLARSPVPTDFYGIGYSVVRHFAVSALTGQITMPTTRDYYAGTTLFLHPFGTNLITQSGNLFTISSDPASDLIVLGKLPVTVEAAAFDTNENAFFAASRTNVSYCNATTFEVIRSFPLTNVPNLLLLSGSSLVCVSTQSVTTRLFSMPNPAAGFSTNTPPEPACEYSPTAPDTLSTVYFDASGSRDAQDSVQDLVFRWDWENDGQFDTGWNASPLASHLFSVPGEKRVALEVQDSRGMIARLTNTLQVVTGSDAGIPGRTNTPFMLPFAVSDVAQDAQSGKALVTDPVGKRIVELDLASGRITREFPCSLAPVTLSVSPDGRIAHAGLTPEWPRVYQRPYTRGLIHEIDLRTGLRTRELEIGADPYEMLTTADTLIVSPATQVQGASAYWLDSTRVRTNFTVGSMVRLALHPSGAAYYGAGTTSVPYDIYRVNFDASGITTSYDSRYHGDYPVEAGVWVGPEGNLVLTRGGGIYTSSEVKEDDMVYVKTLEGGLAEDMFFDAARKALFTVADKKLCYYNNGTYALAKQYALASGGRFVLATTNSLFALCVTSNATVIQVFPNPTVGGETNQPPQAHFTWQGGGTMPVVIRFDGSSTVDENEQTNTLQYRWDFDDDGMFDTAYTNSPAAAFAYSLPGTKIVSLQVKDRHGALGLVRQAVDLATPATQPAPGVVEVRFETTIGASAAVFDPVRPYLYALRDTTRRLLKINLVTGLVEGEVNFAYKPTAITINAQGSHLFVALQQKDWSAAVPSSLIAEFELSAGLNYRTFPVLMDVYKIAATDRRIVIVTGYSKHIAALASFDSVTGTQLGQGGVYHNSELALPRAQNKVFISERNLSPPSIYQIVFDPLTGQLGAGTAIGGAGGAIFPEPGGEWVLNAYGNVHTTNGVLVRRLENGTAADAWFDPSRPALFTAAAGNVCFYNPRTLELARVYPALPGTSYVGGWGGSVYAASLETNRLVVQRLLSPALGAETNLPPQPAFSPSESPFPTFRAITFDARATQDDSSSSAQLLYRWDWDSDGVFETPFTNQPVAVHSYSLAGQARITLQVKDEFGSVASLARTFPMVPTADYGTATTNLLATARGLSVGEAVFDPVRPFLYLTDTASNRVLRVNIQTGVMDRSFSLDHTPESIAITPSGSRMYVAELYGPHDSQNYGTSRGLINVFDLENLARVSQFEIQDDPFDLLATETLLVVASGLGTGGFRTYRQAGSQELAYWPSYTSRNIRMAGHPSQGFFYGGSTWSMGGDVHRYDLNAVTGTIVETALRSGLDAWPPLVVVNPQGTNLVTRKGYVCKVTTDPATDLLEKATLTPSYVESAVFVPERQALFTCAGSSLHYFDGRSIQLKHTFDLGYTGKKLAVYGDRLYSLCDAGTNLLMVSRLLPSISAQTNLAPSMVRITYPTNGTVISLPGVLQLEASAEDPDGWIGRVDYYLGLALLGSATNAPFRVAWTNPPPGAYPVTAVAQDNWGVTVVSEPIMVILNVPPTVEITSPAPGAVFVTPAAIQVAAVASDPDGAVELVQYFLNSAYAGSASAPAFEFVITEPPLGTNALVAVAVDNFGTQSARTTNRFVVLPAIANDPFNGSLGVSSSLWSVTGSNVRATAEKGEPLHAAVAGGHSLWWTWTAPAAGIVTLDTAGSDFDTVLAVYTGTTLSNLTAVASNDDFPGMGVLSRVKFACGASGVYRIAVDGNRGAAGGVRLNLALTPGVTLPTVGNDFFLSRQQVTWTSNLISIVASNQFATREGTEPSHAGQTGGKSLWWTWVAPANGSVRATTGGSDFDTLLAVYTGSSLSFSTAVASNDDDPAGGLTSASSFNVSAGVSYNVAVDGFNGASGRIALGLTFSTNRVDLAPNDQFEQRSRLTNNSFLEVASSTFASKELLEPSHAGNGGGKSLWWTWTPPASGSARVSTKRSGFDTLLAIYTGADLPGLSQVAANDDPGSGSTQGEVRFDVIAGSTYQIAVDGYNGAGGTVMLSGTIDLAGNAPANDLFANAETLTGTNLTIETSSVGASREKSEPLIAGVEGGKSLWWSWTAPTNGVLIVSTKGSDFDTLLGLFSGTTLTLLSGMASSDDVLPEVGSRIKTVVTSGSTYRIAVDGYRGASGNVRLNLLFIPAAPATSNDMFANRFVLTGVSNSVAALTAGATKESFEPVHAGNSGGHSLWWSWTAPASGTFGLSTAGSDFDTLLAVYTGGSPSTLSVVASNDDVTLGDLSSRVTFNASAGSSYQIAADGYAGSVGNLQLMLFATQHGIARPSNDDFAERAAIVGHTAAVGGQNAGATSEPGEPSLPGSMARQTVWWTWRAPATGPVEISTKGSTFDTLLAVYSGGTLAELARVAANDDDPLGGSSSRLTFEAMGGEAYAIQVDGYQGRTGEVALTLRATIPVAILSPGLLAEGYAFRVEGPPNSACIVETSTDLSTWVPVATNRPPFDYVYPMPGSERARFFRVK